MVNGDDALGRRVAALLRGAGRTVSTVGTHPGVDYRVRRAVWSLHAMELSLATPMGPVEMTTPLIGHHNAANLAGALAAADLIGVPRSVSVDALSHAAAPPDDCSTFRRGSRSP